MIAYLERTIPSIRLLGGILWKYFSQVLQAAYIMFVVWFIAGLLFHLTEKSNAQLASDLDDYDEKHSRYWTVINGMQFVIVHMTGKKPRPHSQSSHVHILKIHVVLQHDP